MRAYNRLVRLREQAEMAWGMIEVELTRRADLITALAEVVRGGRDHETQMLVTAATRWSRGWQKHRRLPTPADITAANQQLGEQPAAQLLAEATPELRAGGLFDNLAAELANTENRIAAARSFYNDSAENLNTLTTGIPETWVARMAQIEPLPYLRFRETDTEL